MKATYIASNIDGVAQNGTVDYMYRAGYAIYKYDFASYDCYDGTEIVAEKLFTAYTATVVNGMKQYTTIEAMQADAANNSFTGWDSTLWTITNGVPSMNVIG